MLGDEDAIHRAVFDALAVSLSLFPESNEASRMIMRSWGDRQPPQASRETNLVFYDLAPDPNTRMYTERTIVDHIHAVYRFMPFLLSMVLYGPRCVTYAFRIRENLYVDGSSKPLSILRKAGIYPQPARHPPAVLHEEDHGFFRKRADLILPVWVLDNSGTASEGSLPATDIRMAPDVIIHRKEG